MKLICIYCLFFGLFSRPKSISISILEEHEFYANLWSVEMANNSQIGPEELAKTYGYQNLGEIIEGSNIYQFKHPKVKETSKDRIKDNNLTLDANVANAEQLVWEHIESKVMTFNDPMFEEAWHLNKDNFNHNIEEAWEKGFTGQNVKIVHIDAGIDSTHDDLRKRYNNDLSWNIPMQNGNPYTVSESHGTSMAGLSCAEANNGVCSVGIAHKCKLSMIKLMDGSEGLITDADMANVLSYKAKKVDIYVYGFGPKDNGNTVSKIRTLTSLSLKSSTSNGRNRKGSIIIVPAGNGGLSADTCATNGLANSIYNVAINAVTAFGHSPRWAENCTASFVSTFSSGRYRSGDNPERSMVTLLPGNNCTSSFSGTSASTAVAGGIVALMLEANLELTWRDVQHVLVRGVNSESISQKVDWIRNKAGFKYSPSFGFGLMDASKLVDIAEHWKNVGRQRMCIKQSHQINKKILPGDTFEDSFTIRTCNRLRYLEHVQVVFTTRKGIRGNIELELTSGQGTKVTLLQNRIFDNLRLGFKNQEILNVAFWGELVEGNWTLKVINLDRLPSREMTFKKWKLVLYGTNEYPDN